MSVARHILGLALGLGISFASPAWAEDRRVIVINDTDVPLVTFNASNVGSQSWEEDILGQEVLEPGQRVVVNINDGSGACNFDLRAIFADKDVVVRRNFNVCTETSWRIYTR